MADKTLKSNRLGERKTMNCGLMCTVTRYGNAHDIDVRFDNGEECLHKEYKAFKNGQICPSSLNRIIAKYQIERIGESVINKNGQKCTISAYRSAEDITVNIEGIEVKTTYWAFQKGTVTLPFEKQRIGEKGFSCEGEEIEIIAYRSAIDLDVRFLSDGAIKEHQEYYNFKNKLIKRDKTHIGEIYINKKGERMTINGYRNHKDVDVIFDDGTIRTGVLYQSVKDGKVSHPSTLKCQRQDHTGEERLNRQGIQMRITRYGNSNDIDVIFEDGTKECHRNYRDYKNGGISHPNVFIRRGSFADFAIKFAWKEDNGKAYYQSICTKCNFKDILTPQEMIAHKKAEHEN